MLWKLVRNFAQRLAGDSIVSCRCSPKSLPSPPHLGSICDRDGEGSNRLVRRRGRKPLQKGELSSRDFSGWDLRRRLTASARQSSRSAAKNIPTPLMDQCASEELSVERVIVWGPNQPRPSLTRGKYRRLVTGHDLGSERCSGSHLSLMMQCHQMDADVMYRRLMPARPASGDS